MRFRRIPWSDEAESKLRRAIKYATDADVIRGEVSSNISQLWSVDNGESFLVTRIEGRELVIVCFEGSNLRYAALHMIELARRLNLESVRWHTQNPALNRMLRFLNPEPVEYVTRIFTNGQQFAQSDASKPADHERPRH